MMTTFIEVRTLWTFHGDPMVPLQKIEWIFTLWKLLAEVAGIALLLWGAVDRLPRTPWCSRAGTPSAPRTTWVHVWVLPSRETRLPRVQRSFTPGSPGKGSTAEAG